MGKRNKIDPIMVARAKKTAQLTGFSYRYVRYVLDCERNSDEVMRVYMELQEKEEEVFKNLMYQQVNKLVPIPTIKRKTDKNHGESARKRTENAENV